MSIDNKIKKHFEECRDVISRYRENHDINALRLFNDKNRKLLGQILTLPKNDPQTTFIPELQFYDQWIGNTLGLDQDQTYVNKSTPRARR